MLDRIKRNKTILWMVFYTKITILFTKFIKVSLGTIKK